MGMKKIILVGISILLLFTIWYYVRNPLTTRITIRSKTFSVDVAVTPKEKERGLSYLRSMNPDQGMLFVYDHPEQFQFWMKGMQFPLDFIWIRDKTIVDITKNVPAPKNPTDQLPIYHPAVPVDKVLELPAGTTDRMGITVGDIVEIDT